MVFGCDFDRTAVARSQLFRLSVCAAPPYGSDGVDDELCGKAITLCQFGLSSLAPSKQTTRMHQLQACRPMNGTIHASASEERRIRGIDNRVDR